MTTLAQLEQQKAECIGLVDGWSPQQLASRPASGGWSAVEVFDHLVKVESGILARMRRGLKEPQALGPRDRVGFWFLMMIFRSDRKVKVPDSAKHVLPSPTAVLPEVLQRWDVTRLELADFLNEVAPEQMKRGVFRHPVSGWMSLPQVLDFFSVHIQHHGFQLARLTASVA